ncbi:unnamed protein product, partial [Musa textilis]
MIIGDITLMMRMKVLIMWMRGVWCGTHRVRRQLCRTVIDVLIVLVALPLGFMTDLS